MANIQNAVKAATGLLARGYTPFLPHLAHFWERLYAPNVFTYDEWLQYDLKWLEKCDLMYRLPGYSKGADIEEMRAQELNIPVFYDMHALMQAYS